MMEVMASGVQNSVYKLKANCSGRLQLGKMLDCLSPCALVSYKPAQEEPCWEDPELQLGQTTAG